MTQGDYWGKEGLNCWKCRFLGGGGQLVTLLRVKLLSWYLLVARAQLSASATVV